MPRYFFNSRNGDAFKDDDGLELAGLPEARVMAMRALSEAMHDLTLDGPPTVDWEMTVTDGDDTTFFTLKVTLI